MREKEQVMYNVTASDSFSPHIKDDYEKIIDRILGHMKEIEYECQFDFNIATYLLSAECKSKPVDYAVIHITAEPATEQITRIIDDAIQDNVWYRHSERFENGKIELTENDRSALSGGVYREDQVKLEILSPDKFLDITRHELYTI